MIASHNRLPRCWWRLAAVGYIAAGVLAAHAQDDPATPLSVLPDDGSAPMDLTIDPDGDPGSIDQPEDVRTGPARRDAVISIDTLDAIDADSIGLLDETAGGFGGDMWQGSDIDRVERLMAALPYDVRSVAMRNIMRRLLLSSAARPDRISGNRGDRRSGDFMARRLAGLAKLGGGEGYAELLGRVPSNAVLPATRISDAEVKLLTGDADGACAIVRDQVRRDEALFWQKALVFCQAHAGELDAASLSLDLLREINPDLDPSYMRLVQKRLGRPADLPDELALDPLNLALALQVDGAMPMSAVAGAGPPVLAAIARAPAVPLDVRLAAAEPALVAGALAAADLGQLYNQVELAPDDLDNAVAVATDAGGPSGRALLYQASRRQQTATERAAVLAEALRMARADGVWMAGARVNEVALRSLVAIPQLIWFAPDAVAALVAAGRIDIARGWVDMLAAEALYNGLAAQNLARVRPLIALADDSFGWTPAMAHAWWEAWPDDQAPDGTELALGDDANDFTANRALPTDNAPSAETRLTRATRLFMALDGMGFTIGADAWDALLADQIDTTVTVPNIGVRYALRDAARARRAGETILLAMIGIGDDGPAGSTLALGAAIRGMRALGQEYDARQLALEAVLEGSV